ncbi:MAG: endonuclease [Marmoricola sp.]|nr:endonuclease [Marmoricola sp.]
MTSLAMLPTTDPVSAVHACLDRLARIDVGGWSTHELAVVLASLGRAESRLAALRLRVLAAADRDGAAAETGLANTSQWAARATNADPASAHREVRLSQGLSKRRATQQALAAGDLTADHAAVIVRTDEQLPAGVTPEQRATVERALVEKARTLPPAALRKAARRALAEIEVDVAVIDAHENTLVAAEEERARLRTRLTLHDNQDGTVTGQFTVPVLHGHLLRKILESMTAPRRGRQGASKAQVGDNAAARTDGASDSWQRARGSAFCELLEHLPTDRLHPRTAATVVVTVKESVLRDALAVAQVDTGADLSAGEVRRLACGARILPAVLGRGSVPLDLGRSARLFSEAQRTALGLVHHSCAADGCERPFAWCELHHRDPWARGGRTDLADGVPLCHFHHQRIHDANYQHHRRADGSISFHQRT